MIFYSITHVDYSHLGGAENVVDFNLCLELYIFEEIISTQRKLTASFDNILIWRYRFLYFQTHLKF